MKISCIIVEDEPLALERISDYVSRLPHLHLVGSFENAVHARHFLKENQVDLIFLDINMDELSGIQLLECTDIKSEVIITTAHDAYALKGYELHVTDYLLKPFTLERWMRAVDKAQQNLARHPGREQRKFIFVKAEYRLEKLFLDEILYIEGMRDYRRIHMENRRLMTLQTFKDLEREIPAKVICRVHKSYMVALDKIISVERDRIKLKDILIPISETYKRQFMDLIGPV